MNIDIVLEKFGFDLEALQPATVFQGEYSAVRLKMGKFFCRRKNIVLQKQLNFFTKV